MSTKQSRSRITVDIPKKDHQKLKAMAAALGKSMREVVIESIELHIHSAKKPNKKTLKALADIEKKKGLVKAKNAADLFKKLGI